MNRENDMRIIQSEMNFSKLKKEMEMKETEFETMRKDNANLKGKYKAVEEKLQEKGIEY